MRSTRNAAKSTPPAKKGGTPKAAKSTKGTPKQEEPAKPVETIEIEDEPEGAATGPSGEDTDVNGEAKPAEVAATQTVADDASKSKAVGAKTKTTNSKKKAEDALPKEEEPGQQVTSETVVEVSHVETETKQETKDEGADEDTVVVKKETETTITSSVMEVEIAGDAAEGKEDIETAREAMEADDAGEGAEEEENDEGDRGGTEQEAEEEDEQDEEEEDDDEEEEEDEAEGEEEDALPEQRPDTERQKRRRLEVFVGGLDKEATEDDVRAAFQVVGEVVEIRLRTNPQTGKNRGYAFVRFADEEQAKRATVELERTKIRDKECNVVPSEDNDTLFLGNLCKTWKSDQVLEKLKEYGVDGIEEMTLVDDPNNEGSNRGYAFLEFSAHSHAVNAFKRLSRRDAVFGTERSAKVSWAESFGEPDEAAMAKVKAVYVDSLPASWDDAKLKELFGAYGDIERTVMAKNMPKSKRQDFAFINYATREAALACIEALNDKELEDGDAKIKLKVELSKPTLRKKNRKGFRGSYPVGGIPSKQKKMKSSLTRGVQPRFKKGKGPQGARAGPRGMKRKGDDRPIPDDRSKNKRSRGAKVGPIGTGGSHPPFRGATRSRYEDTEYTRGIRSNRSSVRGRGSSSRRGSGGMYRESYTAGAPVSLPRARGYSEHPTLRDEVYAQRPERGYAYAPVVRDYAEAGLGVKRSYPTLDEEAAYYESARRGYPRARVDYADMGASSLLEPSRVPLARSALGGRSVLPAAAGAGASSLYGSVSHSSVLPAAGDYLSSATELRGGAYASSLYGGRPGAGYGIPPGGLGGSSAYY